MIIIINKIKNYNFVNTIKKQNQRCKEIKRINGGGGCVCV